MLPFDNEILFGSFTNLFILGWFALFVASFLKDASVVRGPLLRIGGRIIPLALLATFVLGWLVTRGLPGDITSFEGILVTNTVPEKVLFAWFEILGLALLVGRWMVDDADANGGPRWILIVGLFGVFVAAAIGLIVYLALSRSRSFLCRGSRVTAG